MGVLKRVSNIFRAKVNNTLDDIENPIELLDQKLRDMDDSLNKAKLSSAQILGNVHEIEKKMEESKRVSTEFDEKVKLAMSKGNEELAKKALARKLEADKSYSSLEASYKDACQKAEAVKSKLKELEEEIHKTRVYRDEAAARFNNAEASKKVNEKLYNEETGSKKINIDEIERKIHKKESLDKGLGTLREEDDLEKEFKKLDEVDLDKELEKYKQN
ncbi:PspA/IM30 family protein [Clostridium autoethanogenum]|uniref:PspA/IM30 family protein n=1 Tax=Clostridium autoethanogenum TaxID=84023 RepID=A0A3M0T3B4_9CLOT|nr:PspA/IM30 family protein [Clostridium autoethanogenum]RMD05034.1 PspA/IM30 family protein [Clostridium autoethanogenum]